MQWSILRKYQEDIQPFYGREEFSNALCDRFRPERPDVLAIIALGSGFVPAWIETETGLLTFKET